MSPELRSRNQKRCKKNKESVKSAFIYRRKDVEYTGENQTQSASNAHYGSSTLIYIYLITSHFVRSFHLHFKRFNLMNATRIIILKMFSTIFRLPGKSFMFVCLFDSLHLCFLEWKSLLLRISNFSFLFLRTYCYYHIWHLRLSVFWRQSIVRFPLYLGWLVSKSLGNGASSRSFEFLRDMWKLFGYPGWPGSRCNFGMRSSFVLARAFLPSSSMLRNSAACSTIHLV